MPVSVPSPPATVNPSSVTLSACISITRPEPRTTALRLPRRVMDFLITNDPLYAPSASCSVEPAGASLTAVCKFAPAGTLITVLVEDDVDVDVAVVLGVFGTAVAVCAVTVCEAATVGVLVCVRVDVLRFTDCVEVAVVSIVALAAVVAVRVRVTERVTVAVRVRVTLGAVAEAAIPHNTLASLLLSGTIIN